MEYSTLIIPQDKANIDISILDNVGAKKGTFKRKDETECIYYIVSTDSRIDSSANKEVIRFNAMMEIAFNKYNFIMIVCQEM